MTLDYLAQAKQHRNTNAATWETVLTDRIVDTSSAFNGHSAVPEK